MTNAIFSQESEFGGMRFAALGGRTIAEFGAALAPANLSARQAKALDLTTSGTSGPRGTTSSRSAALQSSLENRLRAKTGSNGSILYRLTWKTRVTPSGRPICALRGSPNKAAAVADFICASGSISSHSLKGWTTPQAHDTNGRSKTQKQIHGTKHGCACLVNEAAAAGWPTPTTRDWCSNSASPEYHARRAEHPRGEGMDAVSMLAGWPTPHTSSATGPGAEGRAGGLNIQTAAELAAWPTPGAGDEKWRYSNPEVAERRRQSGKQIGLEAAACLATMPNDSTAFLIMTPDGQTQISYIAATGGGVQLNPGHSRWLMRFPVQWEQCAPNYGPYALLQALANAT